MEEKEELASLKLYNSMTKKKEELRPIDGQHVKMYTCGPTVYHFVHIGNFRTFLFEDLLRRVIKFFGFKITHVMNLTDVDDKTIKGAIASQLSLDAFTRPYKQAFFQDLEVLNIEKAEHYPAATCYIAEMVKMIEVLLEKQIAYKGGDGSIYFSIQKFPSYGCLSHLKMEELRQGASNRNVSDEYEKESASDFVLWKSYDAKRDGEIFWESSLGKGRPGWHLECSCMAISLLGETIDIHVGGVDNLFPHHENEIAQSEAYSGKPFAKIWMHAEHLIVEGKKMSKSLNNFYTLRDLLEKGFTGAQIRYLLLQTHYKTQLNFTFEGLKAAQSSLQRLNAFVDRLKEIDQESSTGQKALLFIEKFLHQFTSALADDLNISVALAALFDFVREVNALCDAKQINEAEAKAVLAALKKIDGVLAIFDFKEDLQQIPEVVKEAFAKRRQGREQKQWQLADQLRELIESQGFFIEDRPQGARLKKK